MIDNYHYYLSPPQWVPEPDEPGEGKWTGHQEAKGWLDLRVASQRVKGPPQGFHLSWSAKEFTDTAGCIYFGQGLKRTLSPKDKSNFKAALHTENIEAPTFLDMLWELYTLQPDPRGLLRVKPVMPTMSGNLELWMMGHSLVRKESFQLGVHPASSNILQVLQDDYANVRRLAKGTGSTPRDLHLNYLDGLKQKFKVDDYRMFLGNLPDEGVGVKKTALGDTFVDTNGTAIEDHTATGPNSGFGWANTRSTIDIQSNAINKTGTQNTDGMARAESDLSGDDHYAQIDVTTVATGNDNHRIGVQARYASGANTAYLFRAYRAAKVNDRELCDNASGTPSVLATSDQGNPNGDTLKIEPNGTTIKCYENGSEIISTTDSTYSGQTRVGIYVRADGNGTTLVAEDLAAGGTIRRNPLSGPFGRPFAGALG